MNGLKRVEGFGQYGGVDGSGKQFDGSVENLHMKHNSCFAEGMNIDNKRARYVFAKDFCAKGEMCSDLKSNPKVSLTDTSLNCKMLLIYVFFLN